MVRIPAYYCTHPVPEGLDRCENVKQLNENIHSFTSGTIKAMFRLGAFWSQQRKARLRRHRPGGERVDKTDGTEDAGTCGNRGYHGGHACLAILAALYHRMMTGEGQNIDISLVDCLFSIHETSFPAYWISEALGEPFIMPGTGQKSPTSSPYGVYNGKNGAMSIALLSDNRWSDLIDLMG